jgi:hypothetical protein
MASTVIKLEGSTEFVAQMGCTPELHCKGYCKPHLKVKTGVRSSQPSGAFPIIRPPHTTPSGPRHIKAPLYGITTSYPDPTSSGR